MHEKIKINMKWEKKEEENFNFLHYLFISK